MTDVMYRVLTFLLMRYTVIHFWLVITESSSCFKPLCIDSETTRQHFDGIRTGVLANGRGVGEHANELYTEIWANCVFLQELRIEGDMWAINPRVVR